MTLDPSGEHSTVRIRCSSEMLVPMKKGDCAVWIIVTVAVVCAESSTRCHVHPLTCCCCCMAALNADHQKTVHEVKQALDEIVIAPSELLTKCSKDRVMVRD